MAVLSDVIGSGVVASRPASGSTGELYFATDEGKVYRYSGSAWVDMAIGGATVKRKAADETITTTTTLQNDDDLLFAIAANEKWIYEFGCFHFGNSTADFKLALTVPAGATLIWALVNEWSTADAYVVPERVVASGTAKSVGGSTSSRLSIIKGTVLNGATPGNVQLQWAQNTSDATVTGLAQGSYLIAHKVA